MQSPLAILGLLANFVLLVLIGAASLPACSEPSEPVDPGVRAAQLDDLYTRAEGLVHYEMPQVTLKTQKESFSLDLEEHWKNSLKAQYVTFPVSRAYYDSVEVGQRLESNFDETSFIFDGEIQSYTVTVSDKGFGAMFCLVEGSSCTEIEAADYAELLVLNTSRGLLVQRDASESAYYREGVQTMEEAHGNSCKVLLESYKTDLTIDLYEHFKNSLNKLDYEVEFPGFLCAELQPGVILDSNFVGWSLFLSDSPSYVTYEVKELLVAAE